MIETTATSGSFGTSRLGTGAGLTLFFAAAVPALGGEKGILVEPAQPSQMRRRGVHISCYNRRPSEVFPAGNFPSR